MINKAEDIEKRDGAKRAGLESMVLQMIQSINQSPYQQLPLWSE